MALGYAYPAYECFKTVEKNKPEIEQLRFWCQYWILMAVLSVFERVGDACISWLPMYSEAKLAFFIYLWCPKTKGTIYVYDTFFRPYLAKHESEIDRNLLELRARAGDIVVLYWQKAATYGQTRFFDILQYVVSQSPGSRSRPAQQREQQISQPPSTPTARTQPPAQQPQQPQVRAPSSPMKSKAHVAKGGGGGPAAVALPSHAKTQAPSSPSKPEPSSQSNSSPSASDEGEATQVDASKSSTNEVSNPPPGETVIEETIRLTRGRLRRTRAAITSNHAATAVAATGVATSH